MRIPKSSSLANGAKQAVTRILKWALGILTAGILMLLLVYVLRGPLISPYLSRLVVETAAAELGVQL